MTATTTPDTPDPYRAYRDRYRHLMAATATALRNAARFGGRR